MEQAMQERQLTLRDQHELPAPKSPDDAKSSHVQTAVTTAFSDAHRVLDQLTAQ